ncbi:MAG: hypothetical protein ISS15_09325 [Alphaproteobacteria bacterium]|nr:hypothetical protein [Alphaproteobacteria bacterium]MBL7097846.1 hypothetical protein [Alphaproteobacteria bacterium]
MTRLTRLAAVAAIGAGAFALTTGSASAYIACNDVGDCWHVTDQYTYPTESRVIVHGDDWRWTDSDTVRYHWREHDGRGYWRGGIWIGF